MSDVAKALEAILGADRGRCLAALISRTSDFQRAEDALQEAAASALVHWKRSGIPAHPQAWLLRAALRKAIDAYRKDTTAKRHAAEILALGQEEAAIEDAPDIPDERLRMIFTCCHPALEQKTRVALTLRLLCGLTTAQVAAVFLDTEATMAQRLSRAKAKIAQARIPFEVPQRDGWGERLNSVLSVIYLVFTAGYTSAFNQPVDYGRALDLCEEAIHLARMVNQLAPANAEVEGALALMLLTHARSAARISAEGQTVPPSDQDRNLWNKAQYDEGLFHLKTAMMRGQAGPFQIKAAISACQMEIPPDWHQIAALYRILLQFEETPVTRLNHAVALSETGQTEKAIAEIEALATALSDFQPYHAARADILARNGRWNESREAYDRAIALSDRAPDVSLLMKRRAALPLV